jgi:hypothetical protein
MEALVRFTKGLGEVCHCLPTRRGQNPFKLFSGTPLPYSFISLPHCHVQSAILNYFKAGEFVECRVSHGTTRETPKETKELRESFPVLTIYADERTVR